MTEVATKSYIPLNFNWLNGTLNDNQLEEFFVNQNSIDTESRDTVIDKEHKRSLLGQIFTPARLAKFMVSLLPIKKSGSTILDPCIGPNTFFKELRQLPEKSYLVGVELDNSFINDDVKRFYAEPNRHLINDSFFNLPLSKKFDFVIQNPPYVRHELMMDGKNSKLEAIKSLGPFAKIIPSKSNLYLYFLIKSIFHLNEGGTLVAVIYDSWLYSDFGKFLKEAFTRFGFLKEIYHFKNSAFPDAEVGATVITFERNIGVNNESKAIKIYSLKTIAEIANKAKIKQLKYKTILVKDFKSFRFSEETVLDFKNDFFQPIHQYSSKPIQRGISCIANDFFIHKEKIFDESIPFIKSVTGIKTFKVKDELSFLLAVNSSISLKTFEHLDFAKNEILNESGKFKALKSQIAMDENWFKVKLKGPGNLLFNYYLRKNIDFILNEDLHYSSDNFYSLHIENNLLAHFALLNSTFTRIAILLYSRAQGNGLRKIQLYEFKNIPVIDINGLSTKAISHLEKAGKKLALVDRKTALKEKCIAEIDNILIQEYNSKCQNPITLQELHSEMNNIFST
jgi:adenine-specific DNA-methyltransferase